MKDNLEESRKNMVTIGTLTAFFLMISGAATANAERYNSIAEQVKADYIEENKTAYVDWVKEKIEEPSYAFESLEPKEVEDKLEEDGIKGYSTMDYFKNSNKYGEYKTNKFFSKMNKVSSGLGFASSAVLGFGTYVAVKDYLDEKKKDKDEDEMEM